MFRFKKVILAFVLIAILIPSFSYGKSIDININKDQLSKGIIGIDYKDSKDKKIKVMISKGNENYTYDLRSEGQFPLQLGNGDYKVSVLENLSGNQYKVIKSKNVKLNTENKNSVYKQSIDMIRWNNNMEAIKKAKEITKNAKTDLEKASIIYDYITKNIKYDNNKAVTVDIGYIPSVDQTFTTASGICFDYSVLYGAMMRSVGVPTKVLMGQNKDIEAYHAWNQVYLQEKDQWVTIDTTYDAGLVQSGIQTNMIKNNEDYKIEKIY